MTTVDSRTFLSSQTGYLQKGRRQNVRVPDIKRKVETLLPSRYFRDEKIFALEKRSIFATLWHVASFTARFKNPGDYLTLEMFGRNFFLIKSADGGINAFHNVCRHRGHPVVQKSCGSSPFLTCKFHGWTYKSDGTLHKARHYMGELEGFEPKEHSLFKIHCHVTPQGFIFVNFDQRETPAISFGDQFGDDFDPTPTAATGKVVGDEFALFAQDEYEYDHTWDSAVAGTKYNWKTFVDGFQECYHCLTGHPTTLPKHFHLNDYYLRQGHGASRHFLPPARDDFSEAHITWLWPLGAITFSENLLFIVRFDARGALDTRYDSETYRRTTTVPKPGPKYDAWMDDEISYWRFVETEDVELAVDAQRGMSSGIGNSFKVHPVQEHAVKWYQDKVREMLQQHAEMESQEGKNIDYSQPLSQSAIAEDDPLCKLLGPEHELF